CSHLTQANRPTPRASSSCRIHPGSVPFREEMPMSTVTMTSSAAADPRLFWEKLWRQSGLNFVLFFVLGYAVYGLQPAVGAAPDALVAFYQGGHVRILVAAFLGGMAAINLMWFTAAIRSVLADNGHDGWGGAATAASSATAALLLGFIALGSANALAGLDP